VEQTPYPYQQPPPPTSGMAIASLVISILGLIGTLGFGSIIGLILGYIAKQQIAESQGRLGGEGVAKAGIILGWIGVGVAVVAMCIGLFTVLIPLFSIGGLTICGACGALEETQY